MFKFFALILLAGTSWAGSPQQGVLDQPGSLLLFPYFSNASGSNTLITVTNTSPDVLGTVDVEFIYVNGTTCLDFNRTRRLTPNDTITVASFFDNPAPDRGFVYAFAKDVVTGAAISWNHLEGDSIIVSGSDLLVTDIPPVVYESPVPQGLPTDVDVDGIRDMNGLEYEANADELHVPRFVSGPASSLVMVGLTGESFTTVVDYIAYNDNEEAFSGQVSFDCWDIRRLPAISGVFTDVFLESTNDNPLEPGILGLETGWIRLHGNMAYSTADAVQGPAFLVVRVDLTFYAELPYGTGRNTKGDLIVLGPFADQN